MYTAEQLCYLNAMGIPAWERRAAEAAAVVLDAASIAPALADWMLTQALQPLAVRPEPVYALGSTASGLLLLSDQSLLSTGGGGPNQPFHGAAGKMLDSMLKAIDLSRSQCQIASLAETSIVSKLNLQGWLTQQRPKVVLFFSQPGGGEGAVSLGAVEQGSAIVPIANRAAFSLDNAECVVSYHPAYLLLNPELKRQVWEDLKVVRQLLGT